jgi:hypothetical protein
VSSRRQKQIVNGSGWTFSGNIDRRLLNLGKEDEVENAGEESKAEENPSQGRQSFKDRFRRKNPQKNKDNVQKETLMTVIRFPQLRMNLLVMCALW